ncbi:MAG: hypothetical protein ACI90U_003081 [Pseudomonadales bacterium]|jgi:hypothetical protein
MLTITKINRFKTPNKIERHIDSDGLYLEITPAGSRNWRYPYKSFTGSWTMKSLGTYPQVDLERARELRDEHAGDILKNSLRMAGIQRVF